MSQAVRTLSLRTKVAIVVGLGAALVAGVAFAVRNEQGRDRPRFEQVAEFNGEADAQTDRFTPSTDWFLRWRVPEGSVNVSILEEDGSVAETLTLEGSGRQASQASCPCTLDVRSDGGAWGIRVYERPVS